MSNNQYDNRIFSNGIHSVLHADWTLRCETPLTIRNGLSVSYAEPKARKSRGLHLRFDWRSPKESDFEVACLHYGYEVSNSTVRSYHRVPASSVRGALRSWTISHLVHPNFRGKMTPPPKGDKVRTQQYIDSILSALQDRRNSYQLIASLFGLAFETREEAEKANAGRLQLETEKFTQLKARPIAINGFVEQGEVGPVNANRQMTVRNPLDRMTHASKEGGLHHFLEFCSGESFTVHLSILNPLGQDIGLLSLWVKDINNGLLRIGALSNIGRGRVSIINQSYSLWHRLRAPQFDGFEHFKTNSSINDDILAGLWNQYTLELNNLLFFEKYLESHV